MKIQKIEFGLLRAPLRFPFKTALRTVTTLEEITLRLTDSEGVVGWGSVVPTPAITGDTEEKIRADLEILKRTFLERRVDDVWHWKEMHASDERLCATALCAWDVALHDVASRKAGVPLWRWLGGAHCIVMKSNMTISVDTPEVMAERARAAVAAGFRALKVKVGLDAELDKKRVMSIRSAVGDQVRLRLDANQGWSESEAASLIPWFAEMCGPLDFIEQPVRASEFEAMKRLTRTSAVPLVADESAMTFSQAKKVIEEQASHALSVKLIKAGGVSQAREILDLAYKNKFPCLMSCMFEAGAGLQAAAHLASMHPAVHWVDLDSMEFLERQPFSGGAKFTGPEVRCGEGGGLDLDLAFTLENTHAS